MVSHAIFGSSRRGRIAGALGAAVLGAGVLAGCEGQFGGTRPDYGRMNMGPGVTRACYAQPCRVIYALPAAAEAYTVRANGQVIGTYPGGQPADLGTFPLQDSPVTITADGLERSTAVLFVLEPRTYVSAVPAPHAAGLPGDPQ
jgi:hypothetical protein